MPDTKHTMDPAELMAYLDGELPVARASEAAAHLESCRECQMLVSGLRGVSQRLMAWEVEPQDSAMGEALVRVLEDPGRGPRAQRGQRIRRRLPVWAWVLAPACLVIGLLVLRWQVSIRSARQMAESKIAFGIDGQSVGDQVDQISRQPLRAAAPSEPPEQPMIARTANLTLKAQNFDHARNALEEILARHRGYMGQLNVNAPAGEGRTLEATLRVPAAELAPTIAELRRLGKVEAESQTGEEVTQQYIDVDARLTNARNAEQRLSGLLRERTGKMPDVLAVEREISRVRGDIEHMEAEKKNLGSRVEFASLTIRVVEEYKAQLQAAPDSTPTRLGNAAVEGYRNMVEGAVSLLQFLLAYGLSMLFWGSLLFFPVRFAWRRWGRSTPAL